MAAAGAVAWFAAVVGRNLVRELGYVRKFMRARRDSSLDLDVALAPFNLSGALAPDAYHAAHIGFNRRVSSRLAKAMVNGRTAEDLPAEDLDPLRPLADDDAILLVDHVMLKDEGELVLVSVLRLYRVGKPGGRRPPFRWPRLSADAPDLVPAY